MQSRSIGLPNPIVSASLMPKEKKKEKEKAKERYWNCLNNWRGSSFFVFFFSFFRFFFFFVLVLLNCRHVFSTVAVSLFEYVDKDFVLEWRFLSRGCRDKTMNVCYESFDNKVHILNLTNLFSRSFLKRMSTETEKSQLLCLSCVLFRLFMCFIVFETEECFTSEGS